jgi:ATP-binding cassette subfamily B protein
VSPRSSSATAHELQRVGLLASLPGQTLALLAGRMEREDVPAGQAIVEEGEPGTRFYVLLSGMLTVSQSAQGARRVLQPGDYFGEVGAAMSVPRTASVRALTPVTIASCDQATFEELVRPLFT